MHTHSLSLPLSLDVCAGLYDVDVTDADADAVELLNVRWVHGSIFFSFSFSLSRSFLFVRFWGCLFRPYFFSVIKLFAKTIVAFACFACSLCLLTCSVVIVVAFALSLDGIFSYRQSLKDLVAKANARRARSQTPNHFHFQFDGKTKYEFLIHFLSLFNAGHFLRFRSFLLRSMAKRVCVFVHVKKTAVQNHQSTCFRQICSIHVE